MFVCDDSVTCNTNRRLFFSFFFPKWWNASNKSEQYAVHLELCLLSLSYKMRIVCPKILVKSHEAYWIQWQLHPTLSAKLDVCIWQSRALGPKKGMRSSADSLSRVSVAALSAASFPRIPTCSEIHVKTMFLLVCINLIQRTFYLYQQKIVSF